MACFTEAMYLLGRDAGWRGQTLLWRLVIEGELEVRAFLPADLLRMRELMEAYSDAPMDLADASLVVLAANLDESIVFTLDSHFYAYRLHSGRTLRVVPGS